VEKIFAIIAIMWLHTNFRIKQNVDGRYSLVR